MKARRTLKHVTTVFLATLILFTVLPSTAFAATTTQAGVELDITTDKTTYAKGETVKVTVKVTNTNTVSITNLSLQITLPSGLVLQSGSAMATLNSLAPDGIQTFTFNAIASQGQGLANTRDSANLLLGVVLALALLGALFLVVYKKKRLSLSRATKPMMLAFCVVLASACLVPATPAYAAPVKKSMSVDQSFTFDGSAVVVFATLSFEIDEPVSPSVISVEVTPSTVPVPLGTPIVDQQLTATVAETGGASQAVSWSVESDTTGRGITISPTGELTVPNTATPGTAIIRATSTVDTNQYGECTVTVVVPPGKYALVYNANDGTGRTLLGGVFDSGYTFSAANNSFPRVGWDFIYWTTNPDGTGTHYSPSDTFTVYQDLTLYAHWTAIP